MGAGHTRGPWDARNEFGTICIVDEAGDYIADISDRETFDENLEVEDEEASNAEAEANARLIAAAPELLEALEKALNFIENTEGELGITLACGEAARAAIAKARGEA